MRFFAEMQIISNSFIILNHIQIDLQFEAIDAESPIAFGGGGGGGNWYINQLLKKIRIKFRRVVSYFESLFYFSLALSTILTNGKQSLVVLHSYDGFKS